MISHPVFNLINAIAAITLLATATARANELRVRAPVIEVVPVTEPAMEIEHCEAGPDDGNLVAVLAWDLGENCRTEVVESATITGYKVFYRWDDRVYTQMMDTRPGNTVPLSIRLD